MPKFTLIAEHTDIYGKPLGHKLTHEFDADTLDNVLENTDLFLRGVGFMPKGTLDYVQDEEYYGYGPEWNTEEFETPNETSSYEERIWQQSVDNVQHSSYFFDTERNK